MGDVGTPLMGDAGDPFILTTGLPISPSLSSRWSQLFDFRRVLILPATPMNPGCGYSPRNVDPNCSGAPTQGSVVTSNLQKQEDPLLNGARFQTIDSPANRGRHEHPPIYRQGVCVSMLTVG